MLRAFLVFLSLWVCASPSVTQARQNTVKMDVSWYNEAFTPGAKTKSGTCFDPDDPHMAAATDVRMIGKILSFLDIKTGRLLLSNVLVVDLQPPKGCRKHLPCADLTPSGAKAVGIWGDRGRDTFTVLVEDAPPRPYSKEACQTSPPGVTPKPHRRHS